MPLLCSIVSLLRRCCAAHRQIMPAWLPSGSRQYASTPRPRLPRRARRRAPLRQRALPRPEQSAQPRGCKRHRLQTTPHKQARGPRPRLTVLAPMAVPMATSQQQVLSMSPTMPCTWRSMRHILSTEQQGMHSQLDATGPAAPQLICLVWWACHDCHRTSAPRYTARATPAHPLDNRTSKQHKVSVPWTGPWLVSPDCHGKLLG